MGMEELNCVFCNSNARNVVTRDRHCYSCYDEFPVNPGHLLIIPNRHISSFFDLNEDEYSSLRNMIIRGKQILDTRYRPDGYNLGVNIGKAAGQTIEHLHIHLIPRYYGDVCDPRGGVRAVIPEKRLYE
jgi:diadenosine tetraphosphate (Ap4A) HIT family hydrolase